MRSSAATVEQYLAELPDDRRETISAVRDVIRRHLPTGLIETMSCGMISYAVPAEKSPKAAGGQPLMMAGLSSGKQGCSLHLMCLYMNEKNERWLRGEFERIGKKLDMGKACIRFKQAADLPLDAIGEIVGNSKPEAFLRMFEASHSKEARAQRSREREAKR